MVYKKRKMARRAADLLKAGAMVLAALFVMSLIIAPSAQAFSLTGRVSAIDKDKETLTVTPYDGLNLRGPDQSFALDRNALVLMGNEKRDFGDIRVGDWVTVTYHEESGGIVIAEGISFAVPPAPYKEERAQFSLTGKVVAIDTDAKTLTIDPSYYYGPTYGGTGSRTFTLDPGIWVMMGIERRDLRDIRVGDWVTVNFHRESNGLGIAEGIAITYPPVPYVGERAQLSFTGKVVGIDRHARTLTIDPSYCYGPNYGGKMSVRTFALDFGVSVMIGSERRDVRDIRVGDLVTVNYHQERYGYGVADGIAITFPAVATCPEERG